MDEYMDEHMDEAHGQGVWRGGMCRTSPAPAHLHQQQRVGRVQSGLRLRQRTALQLQPLQPPQLTQALRDRLDA